MQHIKFAQPLITEEDKLAVLEVLGQARLTDGLQCELFEQEFAAFVGGGHAVAVSSCWAALHLSYLALGIGPGHEVICPAMSHVATAHAIEAVGAKPVFVDCDWRTGNIDAERIQPYLTPRTKAISVVHFAGIPCRLDGLFRLSSETQCELVLDCALALGATYASRSVGLCYGTSCYSFYPAKHITTGEGGMIAVWQPEEARRLRQLRGFGVIHRQNAHYDVTRLGYNYRMNEMSAVLGRTQLQRFSLEQRVQNKAALSDALCDLEQRGDLYMLTFEEDEENPVAYRDACYCTVVLLQGRWAQRRNELRGRLHERGIETSIYYPHPIPRLQYYQQKYGVFHVEEFPNATAIADCSIAFPVGPHLSEEDIAYMADSFIQLF